MQENLYATEEHIMHTVYAWHTSSTSQRLKADRNYRDMWIASMINAQSEAKNVKRFGPLEESQGQRMHLSGCLHGQACASMNHTQTGSDKCHCTPPQGHHKIGWNNDTKTKVEEACHAKSVDTLHKQSTPFLTEPLLSIFGKAAIFTMAFNQVLSRTSKCLPECDLMA